MRHLYRHLTLNVFIALVVFMISIGIRPGIFTENLMHFGIAGICYYGLHFLISVLVGKYNYTNQSSFRQIFSKYLDPWLVSSGIGLLVLVIFYIDWLSRQWIFINLFGLIAGETFLVIMISTFKGSAQIRDSKEIRENGRVDVSALYPPPSTGLITGENEPDCEGWLQDKPELATFIRNSSGQSSGPCMVLNTGKPEDLLKIFPGRYRQIVSSFRMEFMQHINTFLEAANSRLPRGGLLMVCAETMDLRKLRILKAYPPVINRIIYFFDFMLMRIFPWIPGGRTIYRIIVRGKRQVISRTEILGRLSALGYSIKGETKNNGIFYVIARKTDMPISHVASSYGFLIHLNRIGHRGNLFKVYKFRTMYPYSEYIQDYVFRNHSLHENGKFRDDFRITRIGCFMRRYWIDELPSLWNWVRGDMKLVGVRPLSKHYFSLYTPELQQKRILFKPGLIPPFYADLPKSLEEIMASEHRYLEAYEKSPFRTDVRYFFRALYNIVIKGAKSR